MQTESPIRVIDWQNFQNERLNNVSKRNVLAARVVASKRSSG